MTELETLQRAKIYLEKLSAGINPITNLPVSDSDIVKNERISKCFYYVCSVLDKDIERERKKEEKNLPKFYATAQEISKISPIDRSVSVSQLTAHITEQIGSNRMKKLSATVVTAWLTELGLLEIVKDNNGNRKLPTQNGRALGISTEMKNGSNGNYLAVLYSPSAQQFILDNLPSILEQYSKKD